MSKFEARYPGRCQACSERIEVGDTLTMDDELGAAVHFECASRAPRPDGKPREVCPRCFTEKALNGACGCEDD